MQVGQHRSIRWTAPPFLPPTGLSIFGSGYLHIYIGQQFFLPYQYFFCHEFGNLVYFASELRIPVANQITRYCNSLNNAFTSRGNE